MWVGGLGPSQGLRAASHSLIPLNGHNASSRRSAGPSRRPQVSRPAPFRAHGCASRWKRTPAVSRSLAADVAARSGGGGGVEKGLGCG